MRLCRCRSGADLAAEVLEEASGVEQEAVGQLVVEGIRELVDGAVAVDWVEEDEVRAGCAGDRVAGVDGVARMHRVEAAGKALPAVAVELVNGGAAVVRVGRVAEVRVVVVAVDL